MASIARREDGRWRARYRDAAGNEHARHFARKVDAQRWVDAVTASQVRGDYLDPKTARTTVGEWVGTWLAGYSGHRDSTVRQAKVHAARIVARFGTRRLAEVRPSDVRAWVADLQGEELEASYVYALYSRLAQILGDAAHDGLIPRSPCSRRIAPPAGRQRQYVPTTAQVWALHDAIAPNLRPAVLLGAFAGLRIAEAAALRPGDVDFMRGVITPAVQYPAAPLKTETARTPIPIPQDLALMLSAAVRDFGGDTIVTDVYGHPAAPWTIMRGVKAAAKIAGLPATFRFHDLRHYFASLLIASGADVKVVQARLRHGSAKTTLDTYGHIWPDKDETSRAVVAEVLRAREVPSDIPADYLRTRRPS